MNQAIRIRWPFTALLTFSIKKRILTTIILIYISYSKWPMRKKSKCFTRVERKLVLVIRDQPLLHQYHTNEPIWQSLVGNHGVLPTELWWRTFWFSKKLWEGGWSFSYFKGESPCGGLTKIGFEREIQL